MKKVMLILFLFGLILGGCEDPTIKEIKQAACTSCSPPDPPPPGHDD